MMSFGHEDKTTLQRDIGAGGKRREDFMQARTKWLERHNASPTGVVTKKNLGLDETLCFSDSSHVRVEELMGHFWPTHVYNAKFGDPEPKAIVTVVHQGRPISGS